MYESNKEGSKLQSFGGNVITSYCFLETTIGLLYTI